MSRIFYDYLVILPEIERGIAKMSDLPEEREELWQIIDELIHHRILGCILDNLPRQHHEEFLEKFIQEPHNEELISYLSERMEDPENLIKIEIKLLTSEILRELGLIC